MPFRVVTPAEAEQNRELVLVDIRPPAERRSELGYLPGSLSIFVGADEGADAAVARLRARTDGAPIALHCTSGRRSLAASLLVGLAYGAPVYQLEGGVLGWAGDGLPRAFFAPESGARDPSISQPLPASLQRALVSCFVGEVAEATIGTTRDGLDPLALLQRCFARESVPWPGATPEQLDRVLERLAMSARALGVPSGSMAANLTRMSAIVHGSE